MKSKMKSLCASCEDNESQQGKMFKKTLCISFTEEENLKLRMLQSFYSHSEMFHDVISKQIDRLFEGDEFSKLLDVVKK